MRVSVVVCTYADEMYEHFRESVESVRDQTYDDVEVVAVVDGNDALCERVRDEYGTAGDVQIHCNDENEGLSASRNKALKYVTGDVVAFIDDDAVADDRWIEELVTTYEEHDALAAGGRMTPLWVDGDPDFLPEEFYWLVGVTHRGFAEAGEEVRNTFGSNISFRTDVLEELGGFDPEVGRRGESNLQAEEPLLGAQLRDRYGAGVVYNPDAEVAHKVFDYRNNPAWLFERAFWQGYSKRAMEAIVDGDGGPDAAAVEESAFLRKLAVEFVPARLRSLAAAPSWTKVVQLVLLVTLTAMVGAGYLYGVLRW